jgi:hypothetical protein
MGEPIVEALASLQTELTRAIHDSMKFMEGNKSAGTRVRGAMQNIKSQAQTVRVEVQNIKNQ